MATMQLEKQQQVYLLTLSNGQNSNTLNDAVIEEYFSIFDEIEASTDNTSLIITSNDPKTFSTGIDLSWLMQQNDVMGFIQRLENFLIRLGLLNLPVIAAINGNAYAGGALLATACDFRLMRADRGRFCYSELNVKLPFTPGLLEIVNLLPSRDAAIELSLTAEAWGGDYCLERRIVNQVCSAENLMQDAITLAEKMAAKDRNTYTQIKHGLRANLLKTAQQRQIASFHHQ